MSKRTHPSGPQRFGVLSTRPTATRPLRSDTHKRRWRFYASAVRLLRRSLQRDPDAAARLGPSRQVLREQTRQGVHQFGYQQALAVLLAQRRRW